MSNSGYTDCILHNASLCCTRHGTGIVSQSYRLDGRLSPLPRGAVRFDADQTFCNKSRSAEANPAAFAKVCANVGLPEIRLDAARRFIGGDY